MMRLMESPEVPLEDVQKHIEEHAHKGGEKWMSAVALSTALLAALAAIASLLAGDHSNEAMICQIRSSDHWSHYQAKGIKAGQLAAKIEMLEALEKTPAEADRTKVKGYAEDQKGIRELAEKAEGEAERHLRAHVKLARAVTLFQIAIAVSAICLLTRRRVFWAASMAAGVVGLVFLVLAVAGCPDPIG